MWYNAATPLLGTYPKELKKKKPQKKLFAHLCSPIDEQINESTQLTT
jgi:hypothetical protein